MDSALVFGVLDQVNPAFGRPRCCRVPDIWFWVTVKKFSVESGAILQ
jgi:hypothetical protein